MSIVRSYPYFIKSLPLEDSEEWYKQTGLRPDETARIDAYVSEQLPGWQRLPEKQVVRIPKQSSKAPRTIVIYPSDGALSVFVCCKKKGVAPIGAGVDKKVTRAIEWLSRTFWAQYTNVSATTDMDRILRGLRIHFSLPSHPRVLPCSQVAAIYQNRKGKKITFFSPLRDGDLESLFKGECWESQKLSLARQILELARFLDSQKIQGHDLSPKNILYFFDSNGQIQIQANDFDCVFTGVHEQPGKGPINQEMVSWLMQFFREDRFKHAVKLYAKKSVEEAIEFLDSFQDLPAAEDPVSQQAKKHRVSD